MALDKASIEYNTNTFLDLQKDLAVWLKESHESDGEWSLAEKKRYINKGLVAIAAQTLIVKKVITFDVEGSTDEPIRTITVPDRLLKTIRVFIGADEYKEMDLDTYLDNVGLFIDIPTSPISVRSSVVSGRSYWWDEATNTLRINPEINSKKSVTIYASVLPQLLENDGDTPNMNPAWSHLAPIWAAWQMLPQDEEHADRGARAERAFTKGIKELERFKRKDASNKSTKFIKDPEKFPRRMRDDTSFRVDLGDNFDRALP